MKRWKMQTLKSFTAFLCCLPLMVQAQDGVPSWLEESLYGNGKINTVIAVVAIILTGIGIWLFAQERKLARLERAIRNTEVRTERP